MPFQVEGGLKMKWCEKEWRRMQRSRLTRSSLCVSILHHSGFRFSLTMHCQHLHHGLQISEMFPPPARRIVLRRDTDKHSKARDRTCVAARPPPPNARRSRSVNFTVMYITVSVSRQLHCMFEKIGVRPQKSTITSEPENVCGLSKFAQHR